MASTSKCEYCGSTILSNEKICSHCGASNPNYVVDTERTIFRPRTIEELKEYCAERGMPLLRMRFFIGENFKEPKAFGIYKENDKFIVYKNKANGERSIRYHGPDEAYAVNELYQKLLSECYNRGIYPNGEKPEEIKKFNGENSYSEKNKKSALKFLGVQVGIIAIIIFIALGIQFFAHRNDGYYRFNNDTTWYRYGSDWYYSDTGSNNWYSGNKPTDDYFDYYVGDDYDSDWKVSDFKESTTWDYIHESHSNSSSSSYDSWDSSSTDWDSDW